MALIMVGREERVVRNETTSREINEKLEQAHQQAAPDRHVRILCECGHARCESIVAITMPEYERLRSDPRHFAVVRAHAVPAVERVVYQNERFVVVSKREGLPESIATEEDPRT